MINGAKGYTPKTGLQIRLVGVDRSGALAAQEQRARPRARIQAAAKFRAQA